MDRSGRCSVGFAPLRRVPTSGVPDGAIGATTKRVCAEAGIRWPPSSGRCGKPPLKSTRHRAAQTPALLRTAMAKRRSRRHHHTRHSRRRRRRRWQPLKSSSPCSAKVALPAPTSIGIRAMQNVVARMPALRAERLPGLRTALLSRPPGPKSADFGMFQGLGSVSRAGNVRARQRRRPLQTEVVAGTTTPRQHMRRHGWSSCHQLFDRWRRQAKDSAPTPPTHSSKNNSTAGR